MYILYYILLYGGKLPSQHNDALRRVSGFFRSAAARLFICLYAHIHVTYIYARICIILIDTHIPFKQSKRRSKKINT